MNVLKVGAPYVPGRTNWPEAAEYNWFAGGHELRFFWHGVTPSDTKAVRKGAVHLGLLVAPPVVWFFYRIEGACDWSDAPYTWHRLPADQQVLPPETGPTERGLVLITLIDAGTGLVRAIREVSMSPALTQALHSAIREQAALPHDPGAYEAAVQAMYQRYPDTNAMVRAAQITERAGVI